MKHKNNILLLIIFVLGISAFIFAFFIKDTSSESTNESYVGLYKTNLPSADSAGRTITLELSPDMSAEFTEDFGNEKAEIVENGTWVVEDEKKIVVTLTRMEAQEIDPPKKLSFSYIDQNTGVLTLIDPEKNGWGSTGLTLQNISPITNVKWVFEKTLMSDGTEFTNNLDKSFSITLTTDSHISTTTDCNNGNGGYALSDINGMKIGPLATTLMFCENSDETTFNQQLEQVDSYIFENNHLHLLLKLDSGTMSFTKE